MIYILTYYIQRYETIDLKHQTILKVHIRQYKTYRQTPYLMV